MVQYETILNNTFDPFNHFGFLTHRVARLLDIRMQQRLKDLGYDFPSSCLGILANLWYEDGVTQSHLGYTLDKNKSSINKMLEALESYELIEKREDPQDKRNKLIYLTEKGKLFQASVEESSKDLRSEFINEYTEEELTTTKKVLKNFYLNLKNKISNDL